MSYCRFSSMNGRCEVYAYEDMDGGVTVHVARNKLRGFLPIDYMGMLQHAHKHGYLGARGMITLMAMIIKLDRLWRRLFTWHAKLENPHADESFYDLTYQEAHDYLCVLKDSGIKVPDYAIKALAEDAINSVGEESGSES